MQKIINFFIFKGAKIVKNNELAKHSSSQFDIFAHYLPTRRRKTLRAKKMLAKTLLAKMMLAKTLLAKTKTMKSSPMSPSSARCTNGQAMAGVS